MQEWTRIHTLAQSSLSSYQPFKYDDSVNALQNYDNAMKELKLIMLPFQHLSLVLPNQTESAAKTAQLLRDGEAEIIQNAQFRQKINLFQPKTDADKRLLQLLKVKMNEVKTESNEKLVKLRDEFATNVTAENDKRHEIELNEELLEGLENFREQFVDGGKIILKTTRFCQETIQVFSKSQELLKIYQQLLDARCPQNNQIIESQLKLKNEIAVQQGYNNVIDYYLKDRMVGGSLDLQNFIEALESKMLPKYLKEVSKITDYDSAFTHYNIRNAFEHTQQKLLQVDHIEIQHHFPQSCCVEKILQFVADKLGFTFQLINDESWHRDVVHYQIQLPKSVHLFFDLFQHAGKQQGGWFQRLSENAFSVQCNFQPGEFFTLENVQTILHELGHVLHAAYSETQYFVLNAIDVQWDFVEVPSQLIEQLVESAEFLGLFGFSSQEIQKIQLCSKTMNGWLLLNQLSKTMLDYEVHKANSLEQVFEKLKSVMPFQKEMVIQNVFLHIFGNNYDYTVGYYSYFFSRAISTHIFKIIQCGQNSFENFVNTVLKRGNEVEAAQLIREYCGGWDYNAFFEYYGCE